MSKQQCMDLNRETAMRLWNKAFGKESKANDFTGRMMAKGAYNDRNSEFGWNVDHILPQSRGGVTADYNLVCCHILTNDEKANRFPCFTANGIPFEIQKVQNHYEIYAKKKNTSLKQKYDDVDFYDSAAGLCLFESLKNIQDKNRFVGTVFIYLNAVLDGALLDFIDMVFDSESISFSKYHGCCNAHWPNVKITISNFDMPNKSDTSALLDKCILLNTYLASYFLKRGYIGSFSIYYRMDCIKRTAIPKIPDSPGLENGRLLQNWNVLYLNDLVLENIDKEAPENIRSYFEYKECNFVFTQLQKNLLKEVNGK